MRLPTRAQPSQDPPCPGMTPVAVQLHEPDHAERPTPESASRARRRWPTRRARRS